MIMVIKISPQLLLQFKDPGCQESRQPNLLMFYVVLQSYGKYLPWSKCKKY